MKTEENKLLSRQNFWKASKEAKNQKNLIFCTAYISLREDTNDVVNVKPLDGVTKQSISRDWTVRFAYSKNKSC